MVESFLVEVYKMGKGVEKELSERASIRFKLHSSNAYILQPLLQDMQDIPDGNIIKFYENFVSELKNNKNVKNVKRLSYMSYLGFDG
jgi:hypothetical protein